MQLILPASHQHCIGLPVGEAWGPDDNPYPAILGCPAHQVALTCLLLYIHRFKQRDSQLLYMPSSHTQFLPLCISTQKEIVSGSLMPLVSSISMIESILQTPTFHHHFHYIILTSKPHPCTFHPRGSYI